MYHLRNSYRLPLLNPFITHYAFHSGAFSPPPPPAASPPVFFEFKLPFCISVWASVVFYTLLPDYRLRFINVWQVWYKLGVHPRSLLTCSWGVVMLVVQCSQKCSAVTSKHRQEGWLSWGCQWSKVYHFVSNPFLIVGKESIQHLIYMMCMAHLCLLACILCTHVLEVVISFFNRRPRVVF